MPPAEPIPSDGVALAVLSLLLKERNEEVEKAVKSTGMILRKFDEFSDPFSPLGLGNGKRLNYKFSREVSLKDGDKEVKVNATYNEDGSFVFTVCEISLKIHSIAT